MAAASSRADTISEQTLHDPEAYELDDLDQWLLQNLRFDDPIESRRRDLIGWLEAANCIEIEARWLGVERWEVRFTSGECATPAQAERLLRLVARGCRCDIEMVPAIAMEDRVTARFRLRSRVDPQ